MTGDSGVDIGHELSSCTTEVKIFKHNSPERSDFDVVLVDTPGYDYTGPTDAEVLEMVADWINKTYVMSLV